MLDTMDRTCYLKSMRPTKAIPVGCLVRSGRHTSFAGVKISVNAIAKAQNIDQAYISRVFRGEYDPALSFARKIAAALGMSLDEFVQALDENKEKVQAKRRRAVSQFDARISKETRAQIAAINAGKAPIPHIPALRKLV